METKDAGSLLSKPLQLFLMCCEMRNFSQVAKSTGLTQSAVSKAIISLENQLGFDLFVRQSRPLALTAEARLLEQYYRRVSGEYAKIMQQIRNANFIKPVLRIGITESLSCNLGFTAIECTAKNLSQMSLTTAASSTLLKWLQERKIDLAICQDCLGGNVPLFRMRLLEEPSVLFLPKSLTKARGSQVWSWQRLQTCGFPMIQYSQETGTGRKNGIFLHARGLYLPERITVDSDRLMMKLVSAGRGWSFAGLSAAIENRDLLENVTLVSMPPPDLMQEIFIFGRQAEFVAEAQYLYDVCCERLCGEMLAALQRIFPEASKKIVIGNA